MPLLTVEELREHVATGLPDDALERLLEAEEAAIERVVGPVGTATVIESGYGTVFRLSRQAATITTVKETIAGTTVTLATNDYRLRPGGLFLERLDTGTNQSRYWADSVEVTFEPLDDVAERIRVLIALIKADTREGLESQRIGDWSETYRGATGPQLPPNAERDAILGQLAVGPSWV